jgi:hypothetical protein
MRASFSIILRTFASGCVAILALMLSAALILSLDTSDVVVVGAVAGGFLLGVSLGLWVTRRMLGLAFPAMGLMALTGAAAAFVVDVPFFGAVRDLRAGEPVVANLTVAGYAAPTWYIDKTRSRDERLSGGRGNKSYGTRRIAPLVPQGWTPAQPVEIWVAGEMRDSGRVLPTHPKFWDEAGGEYVRLVGKDSSGAKLQAGRTAEANGLRAAEEPVVVMRVASVNSAIARQIRTLIGAVCYPLGAWALMLGIAAALVVWRNRRSIIAPR